jgi:hypothetical protein
MLNCAFEGDAAGLAAIRRSPAQDEKILDSQKRHLEFFATFVAEADGQSDSSRCTAS